MLHSIVFQSRELRVQEVEAVIRIEHHVLEEGRAHVSDHLVLSEVWVRIDRLMVWFSVNE